MLCTSETAVEFFEIYGVFWKYIFYRFTPVLGGNLFIVYIHWVREKKLNHLMAGWISINYFLQKFTLNIFGKQYTQS